MTLDAGRCPNGHLTYPTHPRCPECGEPQEETVDIAGGTGTVLTWTLATATPPGVRSPNPLAIVEFDVDGESVRALGQLTDEDVETGDEVRPVHVEELREPGAGIRHPDSQDWDGYRFEPV
ncbi:nucleic acid-binding protein [Halobacteriales archaeon QS_8_69_26]|nr:MAG: nucleic acid-binding protein [Halobacteriales archaeon QS_8_69_26]